MSEPVVVTIDLAAVDDVPTTYPFSYTLVESGGEWIENGLWCTQVKGVPSVPTGCTREQMPIGNMIDVQLLATDDPNEQGKPLELFITSLPTKGTVHCAKIPSSPHDARTHIHMHMHMQMHMSRPSLCRLASHARLPFCAPQLKVRQAGGSLTPITAAYDEGAVGTLILYQYLNSTTTGLATFGPSLTTDSRYYKSAPPYTETIQATVTTPVYITGVEIGLPYGSSAPPRCAYALHHRCR